MSKILLLSTYELGAQPLGCARPAAALVSAGHEVRSVDLSIDELDTASVNWADAVAFSVPMHTAIRLGLSALATVRSLRDDVPVAFHGLYAQAALSGEHFRANDLVTAGDVDEALIDWAAAIGRVKPSTGAVIDTVQVRVDIGQARHSLNTPKGRIPLRDGLPSLERYARLIGHGPDRLVGAVETTHGCNHRCRHCPVPVVYNGRSRVYEETAVLADIDQLVEAGAEHIHFGDPDFLNRPTHAELIVDAMHRRHPQLTFDITVKVSHILGHRNLWGEFARAGLVFVTSAFESTSDIVLNRLDKGHTYDDLFTVVDLLRQSGIEPRPSLLPFTPWTTRDDLVVLFDFVASTDLIENVDPVQYAIRLLLPPGSLLLTDPDPVLTESLGEADPDGVAISWRSKDPLLDELAQAMAERAEAATSCEQSTMATYLGLRELLYRMLDRPDPGLPQVSTTPGPLPSERARLSESWFCCAEPTVNQRALLGGTS